MQFFVTFASEDLDLKSLIRARDPASNEWMKIFNLLWIRYRLATSKYCLSKFAESHDINDIKELGIFTLYKKLYSWFLDKSKFDFF